MVYLLFCLFVERIYGFSLMFVKAACFQACLSRMYVYLVLGHGSSAMFVCDVMTTCSRVQGTRYSVTTAAHEASSWRVAG